MHGIIRIKVAAGLRDQGYGFLEARHLSESLSSDVIEGYAAAAGAPTSLAAVPVGAGGEILKQFLDAIKAFIESPAGQQLIAALIKLLLGGL